MLLTGRSAVVTGSGTGIGRAIALALAAEGANVVATDLRPETAEETAALIARAGGTALPRRLDVLNPAEIDAAIQATVARFGRLDIWVNNAGVSTMNRVVDLTEEEWDYNMDVNAKGPFLCSRAAARQMIRQGGKGKIITVASMAGKLPAPFLAHYVASKHAVIGFSKALALELAPYGITVNCVCPGYVRTGMQEREVQWEAKLLGTTPEEVRASYVRHTPLGRLEEPEDVAGVVVFLASAAADFMTGQAVNVTGGACMV